jgi:hypothetical protein
MAPTRRLLLCLPLLSALLLAACREARITSYRVPKEPAATPPPAPTEGALPPGHPAVAPGAGTDMASAAVPKAAGPNLLWTAPAAWTPKPPSAMRKGSYTVRGPEGEGDLSIAAFPGDVGGDLANINRWRGQLGLPAVERLDGVVEPLEANGLHLIVFDGANDGRRMLGAIVPRPGETWFFKLAGPDALVAREKPAFLDFLRTVHAPAP